MGPTRVEEQHHPRPTYGALDPTAELLAKLLSGSEDPDVTALSEAIKAKLGIAEPLPKPELPSLSPGLSTLAEDLKRSRVSRLLPKVTCPSPFHPRARTVPMADLQDVLVTESERRGLSALAPLAGVSPTGLTPGGGKTGHPGGVSELDAALHLLHPLDEDLEVGEVMVFVEGADEASARPRPTNPVYDGTGPTPPYAVVCETFPREPTWCPALPPATHAPRGWANPDLSPPLSRTRGAHHRGQVLWQECPGTPLLLLVVATRGDLGRILGISPTHLYGATPVPRPPLPALAARDGVHTFLRTQEVTAVTGLHLVRLPPTPLDDPRGPRALGPAPDWELWRDAWAAWLARLPSQ